MDITAYLDIIQEQRQMVVDLDDLEVTLLAKQIAFYAAMINAANDDPLDEPENHTAVMHVMTRVFNGLVEEYQKKINLLI